MTTLATVPAGAVAQAAMVARELPRRIAGLEAGNEAERVRVNQLEGTVAAQSLHTPLVEKEIVGTVLYLASELASPITGALLTIDKGLIKY